MKDTVIKGDGTSRAIKAPPDMPATYDAWRAQLMAGDGRLDIGLNADGCEVVGTPLNKATLLKDETAAALGLAGDPTVDEALRKLSKGDFKIGDILTTTRTGLDDTWALCNGELVNQEDYPELYAYLKDGSAYQMSDDTPLVTGLMPGDLRTVEHINGYWIACGRQNISSNENAAAISYTTDLNGEWTVVPIVSNSGSNSGALTITKIAYVKGYWVAGGFYNSSSSDTASYKTFFSYSTSLDGEWSAPIALGDSLDNNFVGIVYSIFHNEYRDSIQILAKVYASSSYYLRCYEYTVSTEGKFTQNRNEYVFDGKLYSGSCMASEIIAVDNYTVCAAVCNTSSNCYLWFCYKDNTAAAGTWENVRISTSIVEADTSDKITIKYYNGLIIITGGENEVWDSTDSSYAGARGALYYASGIQTSRDNWTRKVLWESLSPIAPGYVFINNIIYDGTTFIVVGENYEFGKGITKIGIATDIEGEWKFINRRPYYEDHRGLFNYDDGFIGFSRDNFYKLAPGLPDISIDDTYSYIKIKEASA